MGKHQVRFKNPDMIYAITMEHLGWPEDEDDVSPKMEKAREDFMEKYFEYGDYGRFEVDAETLECRLLPRAEWRGR